MLHFLGSSECLLGQVQATFRHPCTTWFAPWTPRRTQTLRFSGRGRRSFMQELCFFKGKLLPRKTLWGLDKVHYSTRIPNIAVRGGAAFPCPGAALTPASEPPNSGGRRHRLSWQEEPATTSSRPGAPAASRWSLVTSVDHPLSALGGAWWLLWVSLTGALESFVARRGGVPAASAMSATPFRRD